MMRQELEYDMKPGEICGLETAWPRYSGVNVGKRYCGRTEKIRRGSAGPSNATCVTSLVTTANQLVEILALSSKTVAASAMTVFVH